MAGRVHLETALLDGHAEYDSDHELSGARAPTVEDRAGAQQSGCLAVAVPVGKRLVLAAALMRGA